VTKLRYLILAGVMALGLIGSAHAQTPGEGQPRCTPGYRPCIRNLRSDVDCAGGGGNGPRYTRPGVVYSVHGSDRYDLDADNDHRGCE
jgi:hypothetical protein